MSDINKVTVERKAEEINLYKPQEAPDGFEWRRGVQGNGKRINNQNYFCCKGEGEFRSNSPTPSCLIIVNAKCMIQRDVTRMRVTVQYDIKMRSKGDVLREETVNILTIKDVDSTREATNEIANKESKIKATVKPYLEDMEHDVNKYLIKKSSY